MRKGFTLLELMIVIIIIGVLATLGLFIYQRVVERSRGAEPRQILGALRSQCAAYYMEDGNTSDCSEANLGIGSASDLIPGPTASQCRSSHFFYYDITANSGNTFTVRATRCESGGKAPQGASVTPDRYIQLSTDYSTGVDTWSRNFRY